MYGDAASAAKKTCTHFMDSEVFAPIVENTGTCLRTEKTSEVAANLSIVRPASRTESRPGIDRSGNHGESVLLFSRHRPLTSIAAGVIASWDSLAIQHAKEPSC
jgi:hypothetical protein